MVNQKKVRLVRKKIPSAQQKDLQDLGDQLGPANDDQQEGDLIIEPLNPRKEKQRSHGGPLQESESAGNRKRKSRSFSINTLQPAKVQSASRRGSATLLETRIPWTSFSDSIPTTSPPARGATIWRPPRQSVPSLPASGPATSFQPMSLAVESFQMTSWRHSTRPRNQSLGKSTMSRTSTPFSLQYIGIPILKARTILKLNPHPNRETSIYQHGKK